ncbi:hypothetical protein NQ314_008395 [Rhamnusium bicolor]|uniref:CCHC-type domain-containing protein n=1 Tax=Rhamnusium bicolor TaxID=1586634 RepID=A0AAV8YAF8_9CUCU|nr:hypothetical protein NQ314_008395 [Rhamnusium bicolor]
MYVELLTERSSTNRARDRIQEEVSRRACSFKYYLKINEERITSVIQMTGFRSLADDEEIEFECQVSEKGLEATKVTGPQSSDCRGSHRRPISRKRYRKIRCYNCGEFANHVAAKCELGPQPKRCHNCKSEEHLIADCPLRTEKSQTPKSEESPDKSGNGNAATSRESSSTVSEGLQPE